MGSFRPIIRISHLNKRRNFIRSTPETVGRSLHHSCASELTRQGIFATLGPSGLQPPFTGAYKKIYPMAINDKEQSISLTSTGQVSEIIHRFSTSQFPVFLLNSRHPLVCVTHPKDLFNIQTHTKQSSRTR